MTQQDQTTFSQKRAMRLDVQWVERPVFPREVYFDICSACNHSCVFCANVKMADKMLLDKNLAFRLIDECAANGTQDIGFHATGEPFMHKHLASFVERAKKAGIKYVFISTNGALATPERAKPVLDAGLDSVKFSVNAGTRESYKAVHGRDDFEAVIEHIKWFHRYREESGRHFGIYFSMVPTLQTKGEWDILADLLAPYTDDNNLRGCSNQGGNMYENNATQEVDKDNLLGSLSHAHHGGKCPDPFFRCVVTPQGFLTACVVDYQNFLCVADLHGSTIADAWVSPAFVELRRRHLGGELKGLICHNCLHNCNEPAAPLTAEFARPFLVTAK